MPDSADDRSWRRLSFLAQRVSDAPTGERDVRVGELLDAIAQAVAPENGPREDARYRGLVERSPDAMAVYAEGRLLYVNEAAARALGAASPAELIGRPIAEVVSPEYLKIIPQRVAEMERTGLPAPRIRGGFRRLDGGLLVGEVSSTPTVFDGRPAVQVVIRDVTEQAAAEAALRRRQQEFEALVENAPDVIARFDPDHRITYINRAIERYTGLAPAEIVGRTLVATLSTEAQAALAASLERVFSEKEPVSAEMELIGPEGPVLFECRVLPQLDPEGRVESALAIGRDLQELRRTELALRRSETTLRGILNGAAIGISYVRPDGIFQGANPAFARMLGYTEDELQGRHFREVTHPDDLARTQEMHDRLFQTGEGFVVEKRYLRHDGSTLWARLTPSLIRMPDGDCYGVGMVEDITQRKAAQEALRASEARFRSLIENAADLIAILTPEGRVLYQSPSIHGVLGLLAEEVIGADLTQLIHPEDRAMVRARLGELAQVPGAVASAEFRMRHADGSWRALASTAQNRLDDPAVGGIVVNTRDLTAARELQAQLLQSQKMEAVGRLAGGIAHDFNNILTAVQGHAGMLALELAAGSPHRPDVEQIQRSVERAASLTRQLLAFSRHQVLQPKVVDLNTMVLETEKMLRRLIGEDVELVTSLEPGLGRIKADPAQVQQVLLNLAVNARDAMPDGGRLTIRTENAELDAAFAGDFSYEVAPGRYVLLSFTDTGCGIEPDVLDHVFEPFFTTKAPGRGTGLGLSSVYGTVKQSGGYIWIDTAVGKGASFRIYLPRVDEPAEEAEQVLAQGERGSGVVLVVEDEPAVRSLVLRVLSTAGYTVLSASDGEQAMQLLHEQSAHIDLVLTDVVMPHLGGGELAARIAREQPEARVLFMSGYPQDALARQGVAEGAGFLAKPFSPELLRRSVADALRAAPSR